MIERGARPGHRARVARDAAPPRSLSRPRQAIALAPLVAEVPFAGAAALALVPLVAEAPLARPPRSRSHCSGCNAAAVALGTRRCRRVAARRAARQAIALAPLVAGAASCVAICSGFLPSAKIGLAQLGMQRCRGRGRAAPAGDLTRALGHRGAARLGRRGRRSRRWPTEAPLAVVVAGLAQLGMQRRGRPRSPLRRSRSRRWSPRRLPGHRGRARTARDAAPPRSHSCRWSPRCRSPGLQLHRGRTRAAGRRGAARGGGRRGCGSRSSGCSARLGPLGIAEPSSRRPAIVAARDRGAAAPPLAVSSLALHLVTPAHRTDAPLIPSGGSVRACGCSGAR